MLDDNTCKSLSGLLPHLCPPLPNIALFRWGAAGFCLGLTDSFSTQTRIQVCIERVILKGDLLPTYRAYVRFALIGQLPRL